MGKLLGSGRVVNAFINDLPTYFKCKNSIAHINLFQCSNIFLNNLIDIFKKGPEIVLVVTRSAMHDSNGITVDLHNRQ